MIETSLAAIRKHGSASVEFPCIGLFASHHREELPAEYWLEHLGSAAPELDDILGILQPVESDIEDDLPAA